MYSLLYILSYCRIILTFVFGFFLVAQLSEKYEKARSEKGGLELKLEVMNATLNGYKQELETSSTQWKKHIPVEEHLDTVSECRR